MNIIKYKKQNNGSYNIYLEDGRILTLYEEVILKYELLLKKYIDIDSILEIEKENQKWDVYYCALKQLNRKAFSAEDLKMYLLRKEYPLSLVEDIINKLVEKVTLRVGNKKVYITKKRGERGLSIKRG